MNEKIKKLYNRLVTDSALKSAVLGLLAGLAAVSVLLTAFYFAKYNGVWIAAVSGLGIAAITSSLFFFFKYRPTLAYVASRIDSLGLEERVVTMLDLTGSETFIAKKQREDTTEKLKSLEPKSLKLTFLKLPVLIILILAGFTAFMTTMTVSQAKVWETEANTPPVLTEEEQIIKDLIDELREIVKEADIEETLRERLNGMIDELEKSIRKEDSTIEKIAKVFETSEKIKKLIEDAQSRKSIGEALQEYDSTEELGKAVEKGTPEDIDSAIEDLKDKLNGLSEEQKADMLKETAGDIKSALDKADEEGELADALKELADDLETAAKLLEEGKEADIDGALDKAAEGIKDAIAKENGAKGAGKAIEDAINDALVQLGGEGYKEDSEKPGGDTSEEGNEPSVTQPGSGGDKPVPGGDPKEGPKVIDGTTPCKEVYEEYYRRAMELLASGAITDDGLRQLIERYFDIIA